MCCTEFTFGDTQKDIILIIIMSLIVLLCSLFDYHRKEK